MITSCASCFLSWNWAVPTNTPMLTHALASECNSSGRARPQAMSANCIQEIRGQPPKETGKRHGQSLAHLSLASLFRHDVNKLCVGVFLDASLQFVLSLL